MGLGSEDSEQLGSLLGRDRAVVVLPTKARLSEHQLEKVRLRLQVCPEVSPLRPAALSPEARAKLAEDLGVLRRVPPCSAMLRARPGLELRELEAKGLAKHRGALELEPRS